MQDDLATLLKYSPLGPPLGFFPRLRLAEAVVTGLSGRLVLIKAGAGYGKTSLLSSVAKEWGEYSARSGVRYLCWYLLGPSDNHYIAFIGGLVEAVRRLVPGFGTTTRAALRGATDARKACRDLMDVFVEELSETVDGGCAIVLDNFHLITERSIAEGLELALTDPRSALKLIISTQMDPKLYLAPLRSRGLVTEIGEEALRFSSEEIEGLLISLSGKGVARGLVRDLLRATDGRPSAAYLAALVLADSKGEACINKLYPTQHGYARLVSETLRRLPNRYKETVQLLSLPRYLDVETCEEGLGLADAEGLLAAVQTAALPIARPPGRKWPITFDPSFRSALEKYLAARLPPGEYRGIKCRLASYYKTKGLFEDAIGLFMAAGKAEDAAIVLEEATESGLEGGRLDLMLRWFRGLPAQVRAGHPRLLVREAGLLLNKGDLSDARVLLFEAQPEMERAEDIEGLGQLLTCRASLYLAEGRCREAKQAAEQALKLIPGARSEEFAELYWLLARSLELMGDLGAAFDVSSKGLISAEQSGRQALVVRALLQLGRLAYMRGDLGISLAMSGWAVQRSALLDSEQSTLGRGGGVASLAYLDRGQIREAAVVAARAMEISRQYRDGPAIAMAGLAMALAYERLNEHTFATEMLSHVLDDIETMHPDRIEQILALQAVAGLMYRLGKPKAARSYAQRALDAAKAAFHNVLADQSRMIVLAGEMRGWGLLPTLFRIRKLCTDMKQSDSRRWLAGGLRLLAAGYFKLHLKWLATNYLKRSLELAAGEPYVGMPFGLPDAADLLIPAVRKGGIVHYKAGQLLGVDLAKAAKILKPLLNSKDSVIQKRAQEALDGIKSGSGGAPTVRLVWPGLPENGHNGQGELLLRAFGRFEAFVDGDQVEWPTEDARDLAAFLLVYCKQPVYMEEAITKLWPELEQYKANVRLREALYRIRETLGPGYPPIDAALESRRVLLWDDIGCSTDIKAFREGVDRVRRLMEVERPRSLSGTAISILEEITAIYRGLLLADLGYGWCEPMRKGLHDEWLWAVKVLLSHYMAAGGWKGAIGLGKRSLEIDPLQEDTVRKLMICYYRLGDLDSVERQYQELKSRLARQRGGWLSEETRNLRLQLLGS